MVQLSFDDVIKVKEIDDKKYDKVSRVTALSEELNMSLVLDVNTEIYPVRVGDRFRMVLSKSLYPDGSTVTEHNPQDKQKSLADKFEYVMHGLLYEMSEDTAGSYPAAEVYVSFGGLQMMLKGDPTKIGNYNVDEKLFLLMRRL
ncbi:DNA-directed RNA polymerases II and V subunit 8A-like [Heracleum sosnowskyi]|uniref:DNA-directed RNA polymerases II and V subunit 8A-like n=1 Tax=Heracleum sosnowskyi TaxID=360622 RepID=A0AAD8IYU3_9APIA|nr:DNA-directed RNA polymerases II and V subunit 8A-like [Heracleum sosnowskyi]